MALPQVFFRLFIPLGNWRGWFFTFHGLCLSTFLPPFAPRALPRFIVDAGDSGGLGEADDKVGSTPLGLRQHSGAVVFRIQTEGEFEEVGDAVLVEVVEVEVVEVVKVRAGAAVGGVAEIC